MRVGNTPVNPIASSHRTLYTRARFDRRAQEERRVALVREELTRAQWPSEAAAKKKKSERERRESAANDFIRRRARACEAVPAGRLNYVRRQFRVYIAGRRSLATRRRAVSQAASSELLRVCVCI